MCPFVLAADNGDMCTSSDTDDKSVSPVITVHALLPPGHKTFIRSCNFRELLFKGEQMVVDANSHDLPPTTNPHQLRQNYAAAIS